MLEPISLSIGIVVGMFGTLVGIYLIFRPGGHANR